MTNHQPTRPRFVTRRRLLFAGSAAACATWLSACGSLVPVAVTPTPPRTTAKAPTAETPGPDATVVGHPTAVASPEMPITTPIPIPPTASPTAVPRKATWWTGPAEADFLSVAKDVCGQIGSLIPGLTLEVSGGHQDFGKVVGGIASGQAPDLLDVGSLDVFAARGILRKLGPYVDTSPSLKSNFLPAMWANGSWSGDTYGIPALDHGPELALIWNQTLFGDRLAPNNAPSSWDDLLALGMATTRRDGSGTIQTLGFDPLDGVGGLLDTARDVTGYDWFDVQSQQADLANASYVAFLQGIGAYYGALGVSQIGQFRQDVTPLTDDAGSGMCAGKQLAILSGYWSVGELARLRRDGAWSFGTTWLPTRRAGTRVQRLAGRTIAIPVAAAHPDDAWESINVLAADDANAAFLQRAGRFASTRSFVKSAAIQKYPGLRFFVDSLDQATTVTSRENNSVAGYAQAKWEQAIQTILGGSTSAADALAAAQKSTEAELKRLAK